MAEVRRAIRLVGMVRPHRLRVVALSALVCGASLAPASAGAQLQSCARIADPAARLACYDELARTASGDAGLAPEPQQPPAVAAVEPSRAAASFMQERWELRPDLKRGIFNLRPHRPIYGLANWTSSINAQPSSPTRAPESSPIEFNRAEAKFQLSAKTKAAENLLGTSGDLWLGYTQVSWWQLGNTRYSSPFRDTDYEPEATLMFPVDIGIGDVRMRFAGLTLDHQSNGRGGTLSRSWNRLIGELGAEYGAWSLHVRPWTRVFAPGSYERNDNPDIEDYVGRGEMILSWRGRGNVVTLGARHTLRGGERSRGSARLDWAFPLVGSINGHVQIFSGYGANLIDYNRRQTSVGLGISFFD